jgi:hypothetical protein
LNNQSIIKLRIDVDYPFPSARIKSFFYIALNIKANKSKGYLDNTFVIAKMVNKSPKQVLAYWFFTPYTLPDERLLNLLKPERHEIGLHVARNPIEELISLEVETGRPIQYYTSHGTKSRFAQILWRRKLGQKQSTVPNDFPLKSFHEFKTTSLDRCIYETGLASVMEEAQKWVKDGTVISIHPEWLFKRGTRNQRGPYYEALKIILGV